MAYSYIPWFGIVRLCLHAPLNCRGGCYFLLDQKSNQKVKSAEMLLCRTGPYALQTGKNLGL